MFKSKLILIGTSLILFGCSSKPIMEKSSYEYYTVNFAALYLCEPTISKFDYNTTNENLIYVLHAWDYNPEKLTSEIKSMMDRLDSIKFQENQCDEYIPKIKYLAQRSADNLQGHRRKAAQNRSDFYKQMAQKTNQLASNINTINSQSTYQINTNTNTINNTDNYKPTTFYNSSDCIGGNVNGQCIGNIKPGAKKKVCHGSFISGQCSGAVTDY